MRISDVLQSKSLKDVVTIRPDAGVRELLATLAEHNIGAVVVSAELGCESGRHAEPGQADRDVHRGAAGVLGVGPARRLRHVDQGLADKFLDSQLRPERLEQAASAAGQPLTLRRHEGYDHSYYFIATFVDDHLRHHAAALTR